MGRREEEIKQFLDGVLGRSKQWTEDDPANEPLPKKRWWILPSGVILSNTLKEEFNLQCRVNGMETVVMLDPNIRFRVKSEGEPIGWEDPNLIYVDIPK